MQRKKKTMDISNKISILKNILLNYGSVTVATSGGVDSMTLAFLANQVLGKNALIAHSVSTAVPSACSERISKYAETFGWNLKLVNSGEMTDINYIKNPTNRCYHCKSCLYTTLTNLNFGIVVSGTNTDDLNEYRPGLQAAKEHQICHPYIEAGIDKATIRAIARKLNLSDLADIPASPCLASRIETGIEIKPERLLLTDRIENIVSSQIISDNIRCRIKPHMLRIEIDANTLSSLPLSLLKSIRIQIEQIVAEENIDLPVEFSGYYKGSSFVGIKS